jgi:hypothetical protein
MSMSEDHLRGSNVEDGRLDYPPGEERSQLELGFPIAGHQEADQSIVRSFEDIYAKLRTWSTYFATEQNVERLEPSMMGVIRRVMPYVRKAKHVKQLVPDRTSWRYLVEALVSSEIFSRIFEGFDDEGSASPSSVDLWMSPEMATRFHFIDSALIETSEWRFPSTPVKGIRPLIACIHRSRNYLAPGAERVA